MYIGAYAAFPELLTSTMDELVGMVMAGKLRLNIGAVMPLSQTAEAHRLMENRLTTGKVVLQPWVEV